VPVAAPPVTLAGSLVRLEPLAEHHVPGLAAAAAADRSPFRWSWVPDGEAATRAYVATALEGQEAGHMLPFATVRLDDPATGADRVVGCTRFCRIETWAWPEGDPRHGKGTPDTCEIGYTWLATAAQRTGVNVEAKLLMVTHAFETWGAECVSWRTDARNEASRRAIEGLGATFEGIERAERLAVDGTVRNTARYSMLAAEWPAAKVALQARLDGRSG
jgi:RimJ/RimL family protein N-acetyltransferase